MMFSISFKSPQPCPFAGFFLYNTPCFPSTYLQGVYIFLPPLSSKIQIGNHTLKAFQNMNTGGHTYVLYHIAGFQSHVLTVLVNSETNETSFETPGCYSAFGVCSSFLKIKGNHNLNLLLK